MGARDYMFGLLGDPAIMGRVHEVRDRLLEFRAFWAERYIESPDLTRLDEYFDAFEMRARKTFERICDDCKFTVTNGDSVYNPYREGRRVRDKEARIPHPQDPGPNQLCIPCENAWLDELKYGWELYCERRIDCIGWGVPQDKPLDYCKCRRLPGGKYMWYTYAIPGYTDEDVIQLRHHSTNAFLTELEQCEILREEVQKKYNKNWIAHYIRKELLRHEIKTKIAEHVATDGKRLELWAAGSEERSNQVRAEIRTQFISKTAEKYGEDVLNVIAPSDITKYCIDVEEGGDEGDLWHSVLGKYDFDQNTNSCLYFIRQGEAVKIGITDNLDKRFSQIRTSASLPCTIKNVVYCHHGYVLERKLHKALARYKSHLEWFMLPPELERTLFAAKSSGDIERALVQIGDTRNQLNANRVGGRD